ncbi:muts domain V [Sodiomyces alkalinus F11]|uniref:DNA mismatch repair protein MSH5 n=1 Tax=Sodiomyces alkalinus (strain CBS 110278 / VKM F-3762 / F11) TaxID=1314773 RepID=A0A3N2PRB7_SODAK|nr:muts domain V [Sodiomyces alkalinus F11]ROT37028.1 muts domain V [Sodiomyces alkalinus F11]
MRFGSSVNLDCRLSIGCAGAVISDILRRGGDSGRDDTPTALPIHSMQMFSLSHYLRVSGYALKSLQIIRSELHPNRHAGGSRGSSTCQRESLCVLGLFRTLAGTPQGRVKLRQIFLRPVTDLGIIRERHRTIATILRPENSETLRHISQSLRNIPDIRKSLSRLRKGIDSSTGQAAVTGGTWWNLARFTLHCSQLRDLLLQLDPRCECSSRNVVHGDMTMQVADYNQTVGSINVSTMRTVGALIHSTVDFEEASADVRVTVKPGFDNQLDRLRRDYQGIEGLLVQANSKLTRELPEWARKYITGCVFWPQLGFLTMVLLDNATHVPLYEGQGLDGDRWELFFSADQKAYYKNRRMRELDAHLGDFHTKILDLEVSIIHSLAVEILKHESALALASDVCGEIDSLVALAVGARKYQWTSPVMTAANVVRIQGGRHPLQELVVPTYVPNDCDITGGMEDPIDSASIGSRESGRNSCAAARENRQNGNVVVLTGPNHSGKSVLVKQVALIVYLAHIGSYVPANKAIIGLTDQILTRISRGDVVSQDESAFGSDLQQVAFCLKSATRQSLVLIDEFGKGTRADDGAGLMTALLTHLLSLGHECPRVLVTTHYHEIFEGHYIGNRTALSFAHMDVRLDLAAAPRNDMLTYLYKLVPGRSNSSFGGLCAALNGVDQAVVDRADAISMLLARNENLVAACARLDTEDEGRLEEAESVARRFLLLEVKELLQLNEDTEKITSVVLRVLGVQSK